MQTLVPDYYEDFHCMAGACPHSCCIGWEVVIDPETARRYGTVPGPLGERLRAAIQKLAPDQQAMIRAIYFDGVSVNDYAARMGVTQSAISHRLQTVKKKMKKLLV